MWRQLVDHQVRDIKEEKGPHYFSNLVNSAHESEVWITPPPSPQSFCKKALYYLAILNGLESIWYTKVSQSIRDVTVWSINILILTLKCVQSDQLVPQNMNTHLGSYKLCYLTEDVLARKWFECIEIYFMSYIRVCPSGGK